MSNNVLMKDQKARRRIEEDLDTSLLVEAGAGSGKTTSLVARMLELIVSGKAEISNIAAITFTNKAAAELRGRFRMKLEQQLRETIEESIRLRLEHALEQMAESFIGTIHAFCGRLLRERPMEAGLDPQFTELDEIKQKELLNRHWDEYLLQLKEMDEEAVSRLSDLGVHVEDLRAVFLCVAMYEDVDVFTCSVERPDFNLLKLTMLPMLEDAARSMPHNRPDGGWDQLQQIVRKVNSAIRNLNMSNEMHVLSLALMFDRSISVTQKKWPDAAKARELKGVFADWRTTVLVPFLQSWREYLHPQLVHFVMPAIEFSRKRRLEEGTLSFQDLLMSATQMLREREEVRKYFAKRYTRLFVDEFQDTDPVQAEMMLLLTGEQDKINDWRLQQPKPGSLFIVGDPKQSIYRFRRADISTYNLVKRILERSGDILQLTRNFRSVKAIGSFVNYAFEAKFLPPGKDKDYQAEFVPMLTNRDNPKEKDMLCGVYTMTSSKMERDRKADIAMEDAERCAQWISWACSGNLKIAGRDLSGSSRPARTDDFMILLKYREFIGLYAEKLEQYGIPADTSGSLVMYDELQALHMLASCLNDPRDRIALLAVLRGLFFGVSDESLYVYTKEIEPISLLGEGVGGQEIPVIARPVALALARLRGYLHWVRQEPAFSALSQIIEDLGVIPYAAIQPSGSIRSGTVAKLLEQLSQDAQTLADWNAMTMRIEEVAQSSGMEGASLFAGSGRAVRIMNLHKAKGLEAPVVFLACPCGDNDKDAAEHIDRMTEPPRGYFTITRTKEPYNHKETIAQPVGWLELAQKERQYMHAEQDRLLYVAATRAKQLLVISRYPYKPAIDPWSGLGTALQMERELEEVHVEPIPKEPYVGSFDADGSIQIWRENKLAASRPSYSVTSVTSKAKSAAGSDHPSRPDFGLGAAFGTVVHQCLEAIGNGLSEEKLERFLQMVSSKEGLDPLLLEHASSMINNVLYSSIWKRAVAAKQRFHEFTFTAADQPNEVIQIMNGVIDLVFEEDDGWVIVDFKTDAYDTEHEAEFIRFYKPQVKVYSDHWQRLSGSNVKEVGLYFLHANRYIPVTSDL